MFIEQPPSFLRVLYRQALWRKNRHQKTVYITFDDGPCNETTPQILSILDDYNVKATFFCVGENVERIPELFDELKKRGHQVGNHTHCHARGFNYSTNDYVSIVDKADEKIKSHLFRPPYGRIKPAQYRALSKKYTVVMWDVISRDYNQKLTPQKVADIVKKYARNGSIIVFHDSKKAKKNVLEALPKAIQYLKEKGFAFETL